LNQMTSLVSALRSLSSVFLFNLSMIALSFIEDSFRFLLFFLLSPPSRYAATRVYVKNTSSERVYKAKTEMSTKRNVKSKRRCRVCFFFSPFVIGSSCADVLSQRVSRSLPSSRRRLASSKTKSS
jgi:hypothetical protein